MSSETSKSSPLNPIFLGVSRGVIGFPVEHPLELIRMSAQASPSLSSKEVLSRIYREHGFKGFSNTVLANFPRRIVRESLRWPFINYAHLYLTRTFPTTFTPDGLKSKMMTGASLALFDSCVLLPLEQLMAYRVKEGLRYRTFYSMRMQQDGVLSLYRGFTVNLIRQGAVWTTFLALNHTIKRKIDSVSNNSIHPFLKQGITSILIASMVVPIGLPLDFAKVQVQMNTDLQKISISKVFKVLYHRHGFTGFYAGILPIFIHTIFQATIKGVVTDKIMAAH